MSSKESKIDDEIDSNLTAILGIEVVSYAEKYVDGKTATFYHMELESHITQNKWTIDKRYNATAIQLVILPNGILRITIIE